MPPTPTYQFPSHSKINGMEQTFPGASRELSGNISPVCDFVQSLNVTHPCKVTLNGLKQPLKTKVNYLDTHK